MHTSLPTRAAALLLTVVAAAGCGAATTQAVQPGAPGEPPRTVAAVEAAAAASVRHTEADVHFMQGMIAHHAQALEMTALVADGNARDDVRLLARRIEMAQADEIELMQRWLRVRGLDVPEIRPTQAHGAHHQHHAGHGQHHAGHGQHHPGEHDHLMPGMLTAEELARLGQARGAEFDRLFLEFMIRHHEGALVMVADLFAGGGGQEGEIFQFASHVDSDQRIEIARMRRMASQLR
jgi:uncharacterized protein (DUF305 family)